MKHFNLFSAIALFCLAAGFVSCTKTVNDDPYFGQGEEILFLIDKEADEECPRIREELDAYGFSVEVCNLDLFELSRLEDKYALVYRVGTDSLIDVHKPGAMNGKFMYLGNTNALMHPEYLVAEAVEAAKASSESMILASPECYECLNELSSRQITQFEAEVARLIGKYPGTINIGHYNSRKDFAEATRASAKSFVMPVSEKSVPVSVYCNTAAAQKFGGTLALLELAQETIVLDNIAFGSLYYERGDVLICEAEKAAADLKSSGEAELYCQARLLRDMQLQGNVFVIKGVKAENRAVVYFTENKGIETEEELIRPFLERTVKVVPTAYNFPLTLTAEGQHLVIGIPPQNEVPAATYVIMHRAMTLAANRVAAGTARIEVSNAAVELLMNSEINQAKGRAFDAYFAECAAAKAATNLCTANEIHALRSGEKAEADLEYLPLSLLAKAYVVEECPLLKAETGSKDFFELMLSGADLIFCEAGAVAEAFRASSNVAYDFTQCDYTVNGKKCPSFMDAVEKLASTGGSSIGIDAPTSIPMGALPGKFTVNDNGKQVYFSKGNLWYGKAEGVEAETFNFENEQWEFQPASDGAWNENHVSHFYWSKDASIACAQKYEDSTASGNDTFFTNAASFFVREAPMVNYFSLSMDEWEYLINLRTSAEEGAEKARYAKATIVDENTSVTGLILFPDEFSVPEDVMFPSGINTASSSFDTNSYTTAEWKKFEIAGAVFLPAAGARAHANNYIHNVGLECYYCSSSPCDNDTGVAHALYFHQNIVDTRCTNQRNNGCCIRLVTEVE